PRYCKGILQQYLLQVIRLTDLMSERRGCPKGVKPRHCNDGRAAGRLNHKGVDLMPIEFAGLNTPARPEQTCTCTFQNPIIAYTMRISYFMMTYGPTDAWVQSFIIKLLPNQVLTAGPNGYQVSVKFGMILQDADGHSIDVSDSVLCPVCIAITGSSDPNTLMSVANGVASGSYQNVTLPHQRSGYSICTSFQSGVNLTFSSACHPQP